MSVRVIAEAGVNHNGSLELALKLVDAAADAGADYVKFQTFKADKLVGRGVPKAEYQVRTTGSAESQFEMLKRLELDEKAHADIMRRCEERNVAFLSSPFDEESLAFLVDSLNVPAVKLGSGEITNAPLLLAAARTGRPVILSTGMSTLGDVEAALGVLAFGYAFGDLVPSHSAFEKAYVSREGRDALKSNVTLLHCTTEYPAPFDEVNLLALDTLSAAFGLRVGFSDHTSGIAVPIAAAARGACVIEKHLTLDRSLPGPDHRASLEPTELRDMIEAIRQVARAMGTGHKVPSPSELKNRQVARKSLVAGSAIRQGEVFSTANLTVKRPGDGVSPMRFWEYVGRTAERDYAPDELIRP